jgi:1-acyl-sn-glycerol-3-phosphate acyltransferase
VLRRLAGRLPPAERPTARRSAAIHAFMAHYFDRFFRRHMNALRVARWGEPSVPAGAGPVIVYSNHPAWWDAAIYILAARRYFPEAESYAPLDAAMLERYRVFGRIGAFGVDLESPAGAAHFLAASADVLSAPNRVMWVAAQGRFGDVRERPLGLKPGVARLAELAPEDAVFLPLAIEYAFWLERGGEACLAFGPPLAASELAALPRPERLARLERTLAGTLDDLSRDVMSREPARFVPVIEGNAGVGGIYDAARRLGSALRGQRFRAGHADALSERRS